MTHLSQHAVPGKVPERPCFVEAPLSLTESPILGKRVAVGGMCAWQATKTIFPARRRATRLSDYDALWRGSSAWTNGPLICSTVPPASNGPVQKFLPMGLPIHNKRGRSMLLVVTGIWQKTPAYPGDLLR